MITRGFGTDNVITRGFGGIVQYWKEKIVFSLKIVRRFKLFLER